MELGNLARIHINRENHGFPLHWQMGAEIIMPLVNFYTILINGQKIDVTPDEIIIIGGGVPHEIPPPPQGRRVVVIADPDKLAERLGYDVAAELNAPYIIINKTESPELFGQLSPILAELGVECESKRKFDKTLCLSLILRFYAILSRHLAATAQESGKKSVSKKQSDKNIHKSILAARKYIDKHFAKKVQVETLAEIAGFSRHHFMRQFKRYTGETWHTYLINRRLDNAEKLLSQAGNTVIHAAYSSGFGSLAVFNRAFKARHNCPPSKYTPDSEG